MWQRNLNSDGFSVVEILLVIVTLTIIGVAGYYVSTNINKNTLLTSSEEATSLNATSFCTTVATNENGPPSLVINASNGYLDFAAVSLKLPVSGDLSNLIAECGAPVNIGTSLIESPPLVTSYFFSTPSIESAYSACTANNIDTLGGLDVLSSYQGIRTDYWGQYIRHVGRYYLYYVSPQGGCYPDMPGGQVVEGLQQKIQPELISAFSNIVAY